MKSLPNGLGIVALAAPMSSALYFSDIPFYGFFSEGRLVLLNGGKFKLYLNDILNSDINGGSIEAIIMMEGENAEKDILEEEVLEAILFAHKTIKNKIETQVRFSKRVKKSSIKKYNDIIEEYKNILKKYILDKENLEFLKKKEQKKFMQSYYFQLKREAIRNLIIRGNNRIDGNTSKDIRSLYSAVDYVTRGTALFMRVETQYLTYVTLVSYTDINSIDNAIKEINEKYYFLYNFPQFATGDISILRGIYRREVVHGHLAQSALKNVIIEKTHYTIRIGSYILEYNVSSSMATVCYGSLAFMYSIIGIKRPVSVIAMGLILSLKKGKEIILSDIIVFEDSLVYKYLKVAGTIKGITACKMYIKIEGIYYNLLKKIFKQAYLIRIHILYEMLKTMVSHSVPLKPDTPIIVNLNIPNESIGCIIVSVGKNIQEIQKKTNTIITIKEKVLFVIVKIFGKENNKINQATDCIKNITFITELKGVYTAKVKLINEFGLALLPENKYLFHISEINWERLKQVEDVLKIVDFIQVKFMVIDGISRKIRFSRRAL